MTTKKQKVGNVPNLRFPGFEGEWKKKKLGEVAEFKVTNSFSRENLNYENGSVKNIHYGDIHTKFQTLFDISKERVPYINEEISINRISEDFYCKDGDIVFADASEDLNDIGKSIEILNIANQKLLAGLHTLLGRPKPNEFYPGFAGYLFLSKSVRTQIQREAQGAKVLGISVGRISKVNLTYPSLDEQRQISRLLSIIDERIQTQSKIIEELKLLKSTLCKKIFSKLLRFKDDSGKGFPDWQLKRLGDVFYSEKGKGISKNKVIENGKFECVLYGELYTKYKEVIFDVVSKTDENDGLKSQVGDLLLPSSTTTTGIDLAKVTAINKENVLLGGDITVLRTKGEINNVFYAYYLSNQKKVEIASYAQGSTIVHLYYNHIKGMIIEMPSLNEQNKIVKSFSIIDEKIETEIKLLQKLLNQKKYLLANLFI